MVQRIGRPGSRYLIYIMQPDELLKVILGINNVVRGIEEKLLVKDLNKVVSPEIANYATGELRDLIDGMPDFKPVEIVTDLREFIKTAFAVTGVEIEFSGRDKYEKAVVIDTDAALTSHFGLPIDILMPGQTIVRISDTL